MDHLGQRLIHTLHTEFGTRLDYGIQLVRFAFTYDVTDRRGDYQDFRGCLSSTADGGDKPL